MSDAPESVPAPSPAAPTTVPIEVRRQALQNAIRGYINRGFRVVSQTETTAQLVKPKEFSFILFLIAHSTHRDQPVHGIVITPSRPS